MPKVSTTAPIFGRAETSWIIATTHTATWIKNSNHYSTQTIRSHDGTSPRAPTVAPTTETTAFRNSTLLIRTCEPDTYIKGLVSLAIDDPWPCAKTAAVGECQDRLMLAGAAGNLMMDGTSIRNRRNPFPNSPLPPVLL